jgi:predicted amidohydrolase
MRLALAQLRIEAGAVDRNVEEALDAVATAAADGADLVVLPEIFDAGYFAFDSYARAAGPIDGPTLSRIADAARDHGTAVLAGSVVEDLGASRTAGFRTPAEDGYANTSVLFDGAGRRRLVYRKRHLFGYGSAEREILTRGESLPTAQVEGFTVGVTTCYDLRFPELYRDLVEAGATLVLVPSAWPYPRVEHWELLPRARAVENLFYVAAANGLGEFEDGTLLGRSAVYDPWGTKLAGAGDQPRIVTAEVDPAEVADRRAEFPALDDRRG